MSKAGEMKIFDINLHSTCKSNLDLRIRERIPLLLEIHLVEETERKLEIELWSYLADPIGDGIKRELFKC